ncbi:MAG: DinB family protein [Dehalococcoidia bacterium]
MDPRTLINAALDISHGILNQTMADVTQEMANQRIPGAKIQSIAAIYAHLVFDEDLIFHGMALGEAPIYVTGGWAEKTGTPPAASPMMTDEWAAGLTLDLAKFNQFTQALQAAVKERVANLTDAEIEREVDGPFGKQPAGAVLVGLLPYHIAEHTGEIAALKGVSGAKGLPF